MLILEVHHLQKSYWEKGQALQAVRDLSLRVSAGEILAFLGPNGAGKTTSIKMMAGLVMPDSGWVRIGGRNPHQQPEALRLLGAVLEGNRNIYWRLTCRENLEYFGVLRGLSARQASQRAELLLERFELTQKRQTIVQSLSRGMQQKLAIAVALMHQPPLLLLDEPTLGLDVEATESVKRLIREIATEGCAIVLTTHQLAIAEELSNRVAIMHRGEVLLEEPTDALIQQFSTGSYRIEMSDTIDAPRCSKLERLGVVVEGDRQLFVADPGQLYEALAILKPLPLLRIETDQATLKEVFLTLVRQNQDSIKLN